MSISIRFTPEDPTPILKAAKQYQEIWDEEGDKIIETLEKYSHLKWKEEKLEATIYEGVSYAFPLHFRASYPKDHKKSTIIHELSHRLLKSYCQDWGRDDHEVLDLFLYDVWVDLYGEGFARQQVEMESKRKGIYDYASTWEKVLKMTFEERQKRLNQLYEEYIK